MHTQRCLPACLPACYAFLAPLLGREFACQAHIVLPVSRVAVYCCRSSCTWLALLLSRPPELDSPVGFHYLIQKPSERRGLFMAHLPCR